MDQDQVCRRSGFSMIEMLVVMAVITILLAILMPALFRVRRSSVELASISQVTKMFDTLMLIHQGGA